MQDLRQYLREGNFIIADGATGTVLQSMGLQPSTAPELWNVEKPEAIRSLHRAYLDAGSQVILTNTFGGNRIRLNRAGGLGKRIEELNRAAVLLAKEEADGRTYVAGDIGPTGELMAPYGSLSYEVAVDVFAQQARFLAEGGVDLIWIETMSDLNEAKAAIKGTKRVTDLPIFCSLSFGRRGRTMMGTTPTQAIETLWPLGLTAIGGNCGEGVEVMIPVLTEMRNAFADAVLIAKPNAGLPRLENGRTVFDMRPEDMATHARHFLKLGAQVIGACCGSSPAHIAAITEALRA
ncbi:MAG: homocysteine S-methyltransferase family protein [Anaerolineae bacterium]|jgi:5-methyltetrahydrofolate--homocysteine methyltransferase|nr:homocysteine S-methyltransferase family protein [Anaerolineae bacterium]MDH7475174.1 homocysteine S-methyltransferase family protein [Anaerolineae bacterium]